MKREKAYVDARRKSILELLRENPPYGWMNWQSGWEFL